MEWVETTGETVEEARSNALDALGVPYDDAEIEVLEEAKSSLFGLRKVEARVRARVRPVEPRAKVDRRDRSRRRGNNDRSNRNRDRGGSSDNKDKGADQGSSGGGSRKGNSKAKNQQPKEGTRKSDAKQSREPSKSNKGADAPKKKEQATVNDADEIMDAAGQAAVVEDFLEGLLDAFGVDGSLDSVELDEETYEVRADGGGLGLLIGPKGATMQAIQDIARTAVQQTADGQLTGRVHIDIGGYRNKRRTALAEFAVRLAETVRETGESKVLEPMPATDRKVVHDAIAGVDGVISTSEGQDARRHIVLSIGD